MYSASATYITFIISVNSVNLRMLLLRYIQKHVPAIIWLAILSVTAITCLMLHEIDYWLIIAPCEHHIFITFNTKSYTYCYLPQKQKFLSCRAFCILFQQRTNHILYKRRLFFLRIWTILMVRRDSSKCTWMFFWSRDQSPLSWISELEQNDYDIHEYMFMELVCYEYSLTWVRVN